MIISIFILAAVIYYVLDFFCIPLSLIATCLNHYVINLPLSILQGLEAILFYIVGLYIKRIGGFNKISKCLALVLVAIWIFELCNGNYLSIVRSYYDNFPINVLGAIGGTYAVWLISTAIQKYKSKLTSFIIWCGRNSMTFLCIHLIDMDIPIRGHIGIHEPVLAILFTCVLCVLGTFILYHIRFFRRVYNILM